MWQRLFFIGELLFLLQKEKAKRTFATTSPVQGITYATSRKRILFR